MIGEYEPPRYRQKPRIKTFAFKFDIKEKTIMANKQSKANLNNIKMQAANEVGVTLNNGYNGDLTARQAGSIGGLMVKKMRPKLTLKFWRRNMRILNHGFEMTYHIATLF